MTERPEVRYLPDQWLCVGCGASMGYVLDRKHGTDLTDKEVYALCVPCFLKRRRDYLSAQLTIALEELRPLGCDAAASVDGEGL